MNAFPGWAAQQGAQAQPSTRDPKELCGTRVEGTIITPKSLVTSQQWGQVTSQEFAGEVAFNLADCPGFAYMVFDKGDPVSFELVLNPEWNMVQACHLRVVPKQQSGPPMPQGGPPPVLQLQQQQQQQPPSWATAENSAPQAYGQKRKWAEVQASEQEDVNCPAVLPMPLYTSPDSIEVKMDLVYAALEDLVANHNAEATGYTLPQMVRSLVREANALFQENDEARTAMAQKLNGHPWCRDNKEVIWFEPQKRQLTIAQLGSGGAQEKALCWYWKEGLCKKDPCPFRHFLTQEEQMKGVKLGESEICVYWKAGYCAKGNACNFRHYLTDEEQARGMRVGEPSPPSEMPLCYFWKDNKCAKGASCPFRHFLVPGDEANGAQQQPGREPGGGGDTPLCWFWKEKKCTKGSLCPFRHHFLPGEQADGPQFGGGTPLVPAQPQTQLLPAYGSPAAAAQGAQGGVPGMMQQPGMQQQFAAPGGCPGMGMTAANPAMMQGMAQMPAMMNMAQMPAMMNMAQWQAMMGCGGCGGCGPL